MARILVGTSGWSYTSWRGPFFPMDLPAKCHLEYYASQFETVELNGVFYRTPTTESVGRWRDETGEHFVFSWNASKFITHWKRLSENSINSLQLLDDRLSILGEKAGPILFQLPPDFAADVGRLGSFLTLLPEHRRYSFEFRHSSWYAPKILGMLADRNIAICISDHHDAPAPWERTANFVYLRGHGPRGRYEGRYSRATLAAWRKSILLWQQSDCDVGRTAARRVCDPRSWMGDDGAAAGGPGLPFSRSDRYSQSRKRLRFPHASVNENAPSYRMMKALFTSQRRQKR